MHLPPFGKPTHGEAIVFVPPAATSQPPRIVPLSLVG
jgi:hypothetical protein